MICKTQGLVSFECQLPVQSSHMRETRLIARPTCLDPFAASSSAALATSTSASPLGGPQEKMPFFQIAPGPILSSQIHSYNSQNDPCKVWLKKMTTSLPSNPPKAAFFVLVTGLVTDLASLVTDPALALILSNSMYLRTGLIM